MLSNKDRILMKKLNGREEWRTANFGQIEKSFLFLTDFRNHLGKGKSKKVKQPSLIN